MTTNNVCNKETAEVYIKITGSHNTNNALIAALQMRETSEVTNLSIPKLAVELLR